MEDWLKCQLSPLVNYRQNQNMDNFHALQISLQVIIESSIHVTNNRTPNNSLLYSETGSITMLNSKHNLVSTKLYNYV